MSALPSSLVSWSGCVVSVFPSPPFLLPLHCLCRNPLCSIGTKQDVMANGFVTYVGDFVEWFRTWKKDMVLANLGMSLELRLSSRRRGGRRPQPHFLHVHRESIAVVISKIFRGLVGRCAV